MGTDSKTGEDEVVAPWSEVSETELHALVDDVLRSGKYLTLPANGPASGQSQAERLHAKAIAEQMRRLAHRIRSDPPEPEPEEEGPDDVDEWWFELDGKRIGPISLRKVRYLWEDGELTPDSLCWHEGFSSWVSLFRVSELAEALAPRPTGAAPDQLAAAARLPKFDRTTASGTWMPSAAEALQAANRLRLAATQKPAAPTEAEAKADSAPPSPLELTGTFATVSAQSAAAAPAPTPEPKRRGGLSHALVTGLVAGLLIAAAVVGTRLLWPQAPSQPLVVVVHEGRNAADKSAPEKPAVRKSVPTPTAMRRAKPVASSVKAPASAAGANTPQDDASSERSRSTAAPARSAPKPAAAVAPVERTEKKKPSVDEAFAEQFGTTPDALESSEIAEVVASHRAQVDACIQAQRALAPEDSGRLVMQWKVALDGQVSDVRVQSPLPPGASLGGCLKQAIAGWRFPKHEVPHGPVEFPFPY